MLGKAMLDGEGPWRVERHVGKDKTLRGGVLRLLHKMETSSGNSVKLERTWPIGADCSAFLAGLLPLIY